MRVLFIVAIGCVLASCCSAAPQYAYEGSAIADGGSGLLSLGSGSGGAGRRGGDKYLPPATTTAAPIVKKQFYLISAPDDGEDQERTKHLVLGQPQKNYRVIFIKAPGSNGGANLKYSAELAPQEEKTVIYVLSKKAEELDGSDIATAPAIPASKPEVFFIKYKTDEEAQQAQKEIQGEYDKLGGSNEFVQGEAPVSSVIGSLDGLNPDGSYNYHQINNGGGNELATEPLTPTNQYLPSFLHH